MTENENALQRKIMLLKDSQIENLAVTLVPENFVLTGTRKPMFTIYGSASHCMLALSTIMADCCEHILFELHENQNFFGTSVPSLIIKLVNLHIDADILSASPCFIN